MKLKIPRSEISTSTLRSETWIEDSRAATENALTVAVQGTTQNIR